MQGRHSQMTFLLLAQIVHDLQVCCECTVNIIIIINLEQQYVKIKGLAWSSRLSQRTHVQMKDCQTGG